MPPYLVGIDHFTGTLSVEYDTDGFLLSVYYLKDDEPSWKFGTDDWNEYAFNVLTDEALTIISDRVFARHEDSDSYWVEYIVTEFTDNEGMDEGFVRDNIGLFSASLGRVDVSPTMVSVEWDDNPEFEVNRNY